MTKRKKPFFMRTIWFSAGTLLAVIAAFLVGGASSSNDAGLSGNPLNFNTSEMEEFLGSDGVIAGIVTTKLDGGGVEGVTVEACLPPEDNSPSVFVPGSCQQAATNANGAFIIGELTPGTSYRVVVKDPHRSLFSRKNYQTQWLKDQNGTYLGVVAQTNPSFSFAAGQYLTIEMEVLAEETGIPDFITKDLPVTPTDLSYNPTNEWDFPHVIKASDYLVDPLSEWYLYTAPHDHPGGISLFYADQLEGPWVEHEGNPVVDRTIGGMNVSHVSTPHLLWVPDPTFTSTNTNTKQTGGQFFMYFHGENETLRFATSSDGLTWNHDPLEDIAVNAGDLVDSSEPNRIFTAAGYARIYDTCDNNIFVIATNICNGTYTDFSKVGRGSRYIMLFTDGSTDGKLKIRIATSNDARTWSVDPNPLFQNVPQGFSRTSSPTYHEAGGKHFVTFHTNTSSISAVEVGAQFDRSDWYPSIITPGSLDNGRVGCPHDRRT